MGLRFTENLRPSSARCVAVAAACLLLLFAPAAHGADPYLRWRTVKTPHFRVHFHGGLEPLAQRTASLAEQIRARLEPHLGWTPSQVTHIRLSDDTDSANGSASALPFNTITLFVTAPDDMSPLGDYDDWVLELLTHEDTHVLHVDNITGLSALLNAIVGKTFAPNQIQPRWVLEGLAVLMESEYTSGGRVRSSLFDMYLRADVLEDNLATLDKMSHTVRRWPGANIWYLYGGKFISWIAEVYGSDIFASVADDYGHNIIPWGLNRSIRRATGRTYPELYRGWKASLERRYGAQVAAVKQRGLREGSRLTHAGQVAGAPRIVPPCRRAGSETELMYFRDDGHSLPGFYRVVVPRSGAGTARSELAIRAGGELPNLAFTPDCGVVYAASAPSKRRQYYDDLFYFPPERALPGTLLGRGNRWTTGYRARDPDVSPDGRRLAFVTNHAGTTTLRIADIEPHRGIARVRALVPSGYFEQAFNPRFSPDGRRIAYSAWTEGGFRDIRIVDVETGRFTRVTHDRAIDHQATWSPDGEYVYFASDRTGISNIYAYHVESGRLHQVTNVINGAYMPEVAPDGRTLFYVGYTHAGFDLYRLPLAPDRWLEPLPPPTRPDPPKAPDWKAWSVEPYDPLPTLRPRALDIQYGTGTYGQALTFRVSGQDIVGWNRVDASLTLETDLPIPFIGSLSYTYSRNPVALNMDLYRDVVPRSPVQIGGQERPVNEELTGISTGLSYYMPGQFDGQSASLSYSVTWRNPHFDLGAGLDPVSQVSSIPSDGVLGSVHVGWSYDNAWRSAYAISLERGLAISLGLDYASQATASEETLTSFDGRIVGYVSMPWLRHHVLALAVGAGAAAGTYPSRGFFFTGGFADSNPIEDFRTGIRQSGFVLRGYAPGQFVGRQYNLYNVEYRFPIVHPEFGISTLPFFLRSLHAAAFADYGGAFNGIDRDDPLSVLHLGVGGELRALLTVGYFLDGTVRFGVAKGFGDEAVQPVQTYIVVASSF